MPHKLGHTAGKGIVPKQSLVCKNLLTHTTKFEDIPLPSVVPLLNHWPIHTHIMHNFITKPHIKTHEIKGEAQDQIKCASNEHGHMTRSYAHPLSLDGAGV